MNDAIMYVSLMMYTLIILCAGCFGGAALVRGKGKGHVEECHTGIEEDVCNQVE